MLGAFQLVAPLGRGGMADVWHGEHLETETPVAIKILTGYAANRSSWRAAFRQEIRAVAGLSHRAIVHVDEFGEVPEGLPEGLHAGSPYLVMELVSGGNLLHRLGRTDWGELRAILLRILDGLAHAHARGLVHRDIKPGNVLGQAGVYKLADFGICHDLSTNSDGTDAMAGTPAYMAPEQWASAWRDYGPWTDLYGLGCLAWALATGTPPFGRGLDARTLHRRHLLVEVPEFKPTCPVPDGFEAWLRSLLVKDPARRVQRAADAVWSLLELDDDVEPGKVAPGDPVAASITYMDTRWSVVLPEISGHSLDDSVLTAGALDAIPLRVPRTWRREGDDRGRLLQGAGRTLIGFRSAPLVGREVEQDSLWEGLLQAVSTRRPRVVLLHGAAGSGKSRLARWMTERSHEVGAAEVLRVDCGAARDPLVAGLSDHLQVRHCAADELVLRLRKHLAFFGQDNPYELAALRDFLDPGGDRRSRPFGAAPADRRARLAAPVSLLQRVTTARPVVLWLDDLHQQEEVLEFVERLLATDGDLPLLVVATVRDDLAESQLVFDRLPDRDEVRSLPIGPVPARVWPQLATGILALEEGLAKQVGERAAGNPLFAVQLIADWVQRELLVEGPQGFRLRPGVAAPLPEGLHQIWLERVETLLSGRSEADGQALEIAALLGARVDAAEWQRACEAGGAVPSEDLVEQMLARRLIVAESQAPGAARQWAMAHGLLNESLRRRAEDAGRLEANHRACAAAIGAAGEAFSAERVGRHLLDAGDLDAALEPLLDAAAERVDLGDWAPAERLLSQREEALDDLGAPRIDSRRAQDQALLASLELGRNRPDLAVEIASRLLPAAAAQGWTALDGGARLVLARVACARGDLPQARDQFEAAELLAEEMGDRSLAVNSRAGLGLVRLLEGQLGSAREATRGARDGYAELGDSHGIAAMNLQLSWIAAQAGELDRAARRVQSAQEEFEHLGARSAVAQCHTQSGWLARERGDTVEAAERLRTALDLLEALGGAGALAPLVKLGILRTEAGELEAGRACLDEALAGLEGIGAWNAMGVLQVLLLPACAAVADWDDWDRLLPEAEVILAGTGLADDHVASFARRAGELAVEAGEVERGHRAWLLALGQLRRLGRLVEARELQARFDA